MASFDLGASLRARGYATNAPAGLMGAVRAFQAASGLKIDGVAGPKTIAALRAPAPAEAPPPPPGDGIGARLTLAALRRFEPFAHSEILSGIVGNVPAIEAAGITTPQRLCHFLAQVSVESGGLARCEEVLSYSAARLTEVWPSRFPTLAAAAPFARNPRALAVRVYGGRLGNAAAPSLDGWTYRGSSGLQTTGRANFREVGAEADPDRLRTPAGFLAPALHYWATRGCNALADRDDVEGLTRAINGGLNGLADRRARLASARRAFA